MEKARHPYAFIYSPFPECFSLLNGANPEAVHQTFYFVHQFKTMVVAVGFYHGNKRPALEQGAKKLDILSYCVKVDEDIRKLTPIQIIL